jgi:ribosome-binding protein aMBF1 (putative translation factor)
MGSSFHQDWEPVVFTKKPKKDETKKGYSGPSRTQKLDENKESFDDHKKIQKGLADAIKSARIQLKMSQGQLAKQVNVRSNIINDIEAQRGILYDHVVMNKIKKVLGIKYKQ